MKRKNTSPPPPLQGYSTAELQPLLKAIPSEILEIKSNHKRELVEGIHWTGHRASNGVYRITWLLPGVEWLKAHFQRRAERRARKEARLALPASEDPKFDLLVAKLKEEPELATRLKEMRASGMTKAECILALWGAKKGGGKLYMAASVAYEQTLKS